MKVQDIKISDNNIEKNNDNQYKYVNITVAISYKLSYGLY